MVVSSNARPITLTPRISTTADLQQGQRREKKAKPFEGVTDPTALWLFNA